ncbi:MAG: tRNA preQ1(34) S-adenosylmethionine ribosyltransferase-isomerase QueA [Chloroflexi bacterium]|nr:tRNA preQ1(34) S-adenosylmethionine ribosyltransferase-isomerase QueA [Chloroflexota bacterium]
MNTSDFDYLLPPELIAQMPTEPRDHSRLLVLRRSDGSLAHRRFYELPDFLEPGDLLVVNDSRVIPARLIGRRPTGGRVELLLVRREQDLVWECLAWPGRRLRPGTQFVFDGSGLHAEVVEHALSGAVKVAFSEDPPLDRLGQVALPPYIHQPLADPERYQTIYARSDGSLAAPTAGLHFTPESLDALQRRGVGVSTVTLHIGPATFLPVRTEDPTRHVVPPECCELCEATCAAIRQARAAGKHVVAVGTTVVRTLENAALSSANGHLCSFSGWNNLMVLPGHEFRVVDALITNFHLPWSTNLMLVAAFAGWEPVRAAYAEAIAQRYRFYSLGDAMLVL